SLEETIQSEVLEELDLEVKHLPQFHTYSDPNSDCHSVEVVFLLKAIKPPQAANGVVSAQVYTLDQIPWDQMSAGDTQILRDYLKGRSFLDPMKSAFRPPF